MALEDRISALTPEQRALFEALRKKQASPPPGPAQPPPVERVSPPSGVGDWPLAFDQERLWRLHQEDPSLVSWNVDAGSRVLGDLDVPLFSGVLAALVRRHAAWRTVYPAVDGRPVQRVLPDLPPAVTVIDLTALPVGLREPAGHRAIYAHTRTPFDLERGPMLRVALVRLSPREHLFLLTVHHTATDWITFQICWAELTEVYRAVRAGEPWSLPPLAVQFPDYALWERARFQGEVLAEHAAFWQKELAGYPLELELPADRPRPAIQSQRGGMYRVRTGVPRTERLRALAQAEKSTLFMGVLAVYAALLFRMTGREKLVLGTNSANRARPELEPVVGFFLTQVPLGLDLAGDPTFRELLQQARRRVIRAYSHQNFPFTKLIEALGAPDDRHRYPVVQALLLILQGESSHQAGDLEFRPVELFDGNSRWDLTFGLYDYKGTGLSGALEYNSDLFDAATVGRLLELFYRITEAVGQDPDLRLSQLPEMGEVARSQALVEWGDAPGEIEGFVERLERGESGLPAEELTARSGEIEAGLRRLGVGERRKVGIVLPPSLDLAAALQAVWRLEGVAVPLAPDAPTDHLVALLADAELAALVYRGLSPALLPVGVGRLDLG